jgi:two-component system OmpR family sensor kinase
MSIFTKVFALFCISIVLMFYLSLQTNKITDEKIELVHKEKYIQASKELFSYLINGDLTLLNDRAKKLNYEKKSVNLKDKNIKIIYESTISFGNIQILKKDDMYMLYMKYLDDEVSFYDLSQKKELEQKEHLNYLIIADILLLVVMLLVILKMLIPLKNISKAIEKFGSGDYSLRLDESKKSDEISKVIKKFNAMAQNIDNLLTSRTQLLNDMSHELRTPISKAMISLEMMEESKYKKILKKSITQIDKLTDELLEIERLNSNNVTLDIKKHSMDTILAEAFSKMMIDNEDEIEVQILTLFECNADINYLSIAIKNLIDNALKYKEKGNVEILIDKDIIEIKNEGKPLSKELDYYLETFTQEDNSRNIQGYGLGLNIVKRVLEYHHFKLEYRYEDGKNIFSIRFHI